MIPLLKMKLLLDIKSLIVLLASSITDLVGVTFLISETHADSEEYNVVDIQQLQFEAQHRWLRPAKICEILRNYRMSHITLEPHRWEVLMFYTATMPMEKIIKIFRGEATGCLNHEDMIHIVFVHYLEVKN
ncbi:hypothetical protein RIF29_26278 [Crotalaria pallida]|uniref:Uncharacterized protein n=1 Tax=Crotalaria pallida TaxID=3830 RepID=A0AAN9HY03_CROPI